ncbi:MAG: hypothetical protein R3F14_21750 [Polyangiaceae bacterium]
MPSGRMGISMFPKMTGLVAVVSVDDLRLGRVHPRKVVGLAAGRILNPELARSQAYGAVIQSRSAPRSPRSATTTSHRTPALRQPGGLPIPGIGDIPPIEVFFDESGFEVERRQRHVRVALPPPRPSETPYSTPRDGAPRHPRPQRVQQHTAHLLG